MVYTRHYESPLGGVLLAADAEEVCGLWFDGQQRFASGLGAAYENADAPALQQAVEWLDRYFSGEAPSFTPPLHLTGTEFQLLVWRELSAIPYGATTTYGALARTLTVRRNGRSVSARSVGGAAARNPVSIIVPCHRVTGSGGALTGYAGGVDKKAKLLELERAALSV